MSAPELSYTKLDYEDVFAKHRVDYTIRQPNDLDSEETLLIVPGIMAKRSAYRRYASQLAQRGLRSVTMSHETATVFCADEIINLKQQLVELCDSPVRLAGHSLGGIHAVQAAIDSPDNVSGLMLLQSAGFGGVQPWRAAESLLSEHSDPRVIDSLRLVSDGLAYAVKGRSDLLRLAVKASRLSLIEMAQQQLPDSIDKQAIVFPQDRLINAGRLKTGLGRAGFQMIELESGGHNAQHYHPDAVAEATLQLLDMAGQPSTADVVWQSGQTMPPVAT